MKAGLQSETNKKIQTEVKKEDRNKEESRHLDSSLPGLKPMQNKHTESGFD